MNSVIQTRLESVFRHEARAYFVLEDEGVNSYQNIIFEKLKASNGQISEKTVDASDLSLQEMKDYLRSIISDLDQKVLVIWLPYRSGVSIPLRPFVEHFDELWYPAADDIWIVPINLEWVLEITHEEKITVYEF